MAAQPADRDHPQEDSQRIAKPDAPAQGLRDFLAKEEISTG